MIITKTVIIIGEREDVEQAFAELLSTVQYADIPVAIHDQDVRDVESPLEHDPTVVPRQRSAKKPRKARQQFNEEGDFQ